MKVAICIPSNRNWESDFGFCLAELVRTMTEKEMSFVLIHIVGAEICSARHQLVKAALKEDVTHILWLDADMTFPTDTTERLLGHDKAFVACAYVRRAGPRFPTAFREADNLMKHLDIEERGLVPCDLVGMAVSLMKIDIFQEIEPPWFETRWMREDMYQHEDFGLCRKVLDADHEIWVDMDLSRKVGHISQENRMLDSMFK